MTDTLGKLCEPAFSDTPVKNGKHSYKSVFAFKAFFNVLIVKLIESPIKIVLIERALFDCGKIAFSAGFTVFFIVERVISLCVFPPSLIKCGVSVPITACEYFSAVKSYGGASVMVGAFSVGHGAILYSASQRRGEVFLFKLKAYFAPCVYGLISFIKRSCPHSFRL